MPNDLIPPLVCVAVISAPTTMFWVVAEPVAGRYWVYSKPGAEMVSVPPEGSRRYAIPFASYTEAVGAIMHHVDLLIDAEFARQVGLN